MAKMKRPIGDLMSGKLGNVVFVQRGNKSYARLAPVRVRDNWSEQQRMYRKRLSKVAGLWRSLGFNLSKIIWNAPDQEMNGYAFFIKTNIQAFSIDGTLIDPKFIYVSNGHLAKAQNMTVTRDVNPVFANVSWINDPYLKSARLSDLLTIQAYGNGIFSSPVITDVKRGDLNGSILIPDIAPFENPTHIYLFFASEDQQFSQSECFKI